MSHPSLPKRLAECPAFMALSWSAKMVFLIFWRGGIERTWDPIDGDDAIETMRAEAQGKGYLVGRDAMALDDAVGEFLARGLLRREGTRLRLPLVSSDRGRGHYSMKADAVRQRASRANRAGRREGDADTGGRDSDPPPDPPGGGRDMGSMSQADVTGSGRDSERDSERDSGRSEKRRGEFPSSSSSSENSGVSERAHVPQTARDAGDGDAPARGVTGATPALVTPDVTLTESHVFEVLERDAGGRVGTLPPGMRGFLVERLVELGVTKPVLAVMADLASKGELLGQKERKVTDLALLAGRRGEEAKILASWVGSAKYELHERERVAAKAAREAAQRQRDLTPVGPGPAKVPGPAPLGQAAAGGGARPRVEYLDQRRPRSGVRSQAEDDTE